MKAFVCYSNLKLQLGMSPANRLFRCRLAKVGGKKEKTVELRADDKGYVDLPRGWVSVGIEEAEETAALANHQLEVSK